MLSSSLLQPGTALDNELLIAFDHDTIIAVSGNGAAGGKATGTVVDRMREAMPALPPQPAARTAG